MYNVRHLVSVDCSTDGNAVINEGIRHNDDGKDLFDGS